jgi:uncharacterized membrane protein YfcA
MLAPMGLVGGALDAIGGGGWGPVGTTTLLCAGRLEPRKAIGSIDTSEFVVAAPIAAWLVRHLAARILGVAAGGLIVLTNAKTIVEALDASGPAVATVTGVIAALWVGGVWMVE